MGVCHGCLVTVNGIPNVRACVTEVKPGLKVETQQGPGWLEGVLDGDG
jgi:predicted molibdopterin-dependent oxidoreductase YjgC